MKLYSEKLSPNGRRVLMYMNESGAKLDIINLDFNKNEQKEASFLAKNPFGTIPVLEVDAKTYLTESVSICKYLEYKFGKSNLFGKTIDEKVEIDMWLRKVEERLFKPVVEYGHHTSPFFKESKTQIPEYSTYCNSIIQETWSILDQVLAEREYVCKVGFSFVDITLYIGTNLAMVWGLEIPKEMNNLIGWYNNVHTRSSTDNVSYVK